VWGIAVWRGLVAWVSVKRAVWQQEFNPILGHGNEIRLSPSEYALPFGGLCPVEVFDSPLTTVTPAATRTSARHRAAATMPSLQRLADRFGDGFNRRCGTSDRAQAQHYSHQRLRPPPHPGINEPAQTDRHSSMAPGFQVQWFDWHVGSCGGRQKKYFTASDSAPSSFLSPKSRP